MSARSLRRAGLDFGHLQQAVATSATIVSVKSADVNGNASNGDAFHWPIFNPMVSDAGGVCEALLANEEWKPTTPIVDVVEKVVASIFMNYKDFDILNSAAAEAMGSKTPAEFKEMVDRVRKTAKS